ncbi:MAG: NAD-dependent epimerase/dehydratase family protein [Muribaculaceae bacterium]|nr:NAD-dependent epimerase/dehydratase family protein [Muribaculaceae bacterium]
MNNILITGANSFVGTNVAEWLLRSPEEFHVDTVDTISDEWKHADFNKYDTVFHVAGIAHVAPKPEMAPLYYRVNCDLAVEVARMAKDRGVRRFIYMSSMIVYGSSKSLKGVTIDSDTEPVPNDFYGDSKLRAEKYLKELESEDFKLCILRPPMIYGRNNKGNLPRLARLASKIPVFPARHNKRSMLYVDNLAEFVKQIILRDMSGTFFPQNSEYVDTVELVKFFAKRSNHRILVTPLLNPLVTAGAIVLKPVSKMFADYCYDQSLSQYDFDYQVADFEESLQSVDV